MSVPTPGLFGLTPPPPCDSGLAVRRGGPVWCLLERFMGRFGYVGTSLLLKEGRTRGVLGAPGRQEGGGSTCVQCFQFRPSAPTAELSFSPAGLQSAGGGRRKCVFFVCVSPPAIFVFLHFPPRGKMGVGVSGTKAIPPHLRWHRNPKDGHFPEQYARVGWSWGATRVPAHLQAPCSPRHHTRVV